METAASSYRLDEHKTWGNEIHWARVPDSQGKGRLRGWVRRLPRVGDAFVCPMQSGRNAIFRATNIDRPPRNDPSDMFWADVEFDGYEGQG